jgi:hypothetical protein
MKSFSNLFRSTPVRTIPWGPWKLPLAEREEHFLLMGTAGAGKTLTLTKMYSEILPHIVPGGSERALIYDKKGDALPILWALKQRGLIHPQTPIYYFNPEDARTHAWDIAADVQRLPRNQLDGHFHRIVSNLVPLQGTSNGDSAAFFRKKLIEIAKLVLHGLAAAQVPWTLRDLFDVLYDEEQIKRTLAFHPRGQAALKKRGDSDVVQNIEASISADLTPYGEEADLMQLAMERGRKFSIHQWLAEPAILVFSGTTNPDVPLAHLNRTFLAELIECLARGPETRSDITWIFLDEAASLGRQERFPTLLRECRSKGASVFLGLQDIRGFHSAMGRADEAESVLAQVKNMAFFKLPDHDTAEWASLRCGEGRRIDPNQGGAGRMERRYSYSKFQDLFKFNERAGLSGFFRTARHYPMQATIRPLLLEDLDQAAKQSPPLGSVPWPGDARPAPNAKLRQILGAPLHTRPERTAGRAPTTGRIHSPHRRQEN